MEKLNRQNIKFALMILPGNGCTNIEKANWYSWLAKKLTLLYPSASIICKTMPDPIEAKEQYWVPFIKKSFSLFDEDLKRYIVGHSSGAVCIMRLLEDFKVQGAVIAAGCVTDLGMEEERISGYYPRQPNSDEIREWQWDKLKSNSSWIVNLASEDDCYIPIEEMREIKDKLSLKEGDTHIEFKKEEGKSHFMFKEFDELLEILVRRIDLDFGL